MPRKPVESQKTKAEALFREAAVFVEEEYKVTWLDDQFPHLVAAYIAAVGVVRAESE